MLSADLVRPVSAFCVREFVKLLFRSTVLLSALAFLLGATPVLSSGQAIFLRGRTQVDLVIDPVREPTVTDASAKLIWNRLRRPSKILVSTMAPGQQFGLSVEAERVKRGVAVGKVQLVDGMPSVELIVDAGLKRNGQCVLKYTASATPQQGIGQDVHTVTYTVTEQ